MWACELIQMEPKQLLNPTYLIGRLLVLEMFYLIFSSVNYLFYRILYLLCNIISRLQRSGFSSFVCLHTPSSFSHPAKKNNWKPKALLRIHINRAQSDSQYDGGMLRCIIYYFAERKNKYILRVSVQGCPIRKYTSEIARVCIFIASMRDGWPMKTRSKR